MAVAMPSKTLHHPDADVLADAYRALPQPAEVQVSCPPASLVATLAAMEAAGFVGIEINRASLRDADLDLRAYKAKVGPCYETGRSVRYGGAALAALDDDNHLIFESMRVCEKTGGVYRLPPYRDLLTVDEADPALLATLTDAPIPFDCNTYERDLATLLDRLGPAANAGAPRRALFYPGPFRALVLADGSILRRGQACSVTADAAAAVIAQDGAVPANDLPGFVAAPAVDLRTAHANQGSACLLGEMTLADTWDPDARPADFAALDGLLPSLRDQLLGLIEHGDKHLVLTGTNPDDKYGCCPSDEVGAALRLVHAGILTAYRKPAPPDACPITVLAFAGEIAVVDGRPHFTVDAAFRRQVADRLMGTATTKDRVRHLTRWLLLLFVACALVGGIVRLIRKPHDGPPIGTVLGVSAEEAVDVLVLFHQTTRCPLCDVLEAAARRALQGEVASQVVAGALRLQLLNTDTPAHQHLQYTAAGFTTGLVLLRFSNGAVVKERRLDEVLEHAHDLAALTRAIEAALEDFTRRG